MRVMPRCVSTRSISWVRSQPLDLRSQAALLFEQGHLVARGAAKLELVADGVVGQLGLGPRPKAQSHNLSGAHLGGEIGLLLQVRHPGAAPQGQGARVRGLFAGQDLGKGALARAIAPDDADALAVADLYLGVFKELTLTVGLADAMRRQNGH
jgi:hypothetical protein